MMDFIHDVYECEKCSSVFELPESEKEQKAICSSCGSKEVKKLFAFNRCKPSSFS